MTATIKHRAHNPAAPRNVTHARRQLAARQIIPDEPRCARYAISTKYSQLPYGMRVCVDAAS